MIKPLLKNILPSVICLGLATYVVIQKNYIPKSKVNAPSTNQKIVKKHLDPNQTDTKKIIKDLGEKLEDLSSAQENSKLTSALLYEEVDKIQRALNEIANSNKAIKDSMDVEMPLSEEEIGQIHEVRAQAVQDLYEQTFSNEVADDAWKADAESQLSELMGTTDNKLVIDSMECRSSICKLTVKKGHDTVDEDAIAAFDFTSSWPGEYTTTYNPSTGIGIAYLARDGEALPQLQESIY